jgi:hypothetical protein
MTFQDLEGMPWVAGLRCREAVADVSASMSEIMSGDCHDHLGQDSEMRHLPA